ncbi:MAG: NAD(P)H-dependent glycerol-3-phosphate dehydrogenase [Pseudomonadota bacterium]
MIGVVGAGAFGTALASAWGVAGRDVILWGRDPDAMETAGRTRRTPRLPDATLPERVHITADPNALMDLPLLVLAVPMQALAPTLAALPILRPEVAVAACKGLELASLRGPTAVLRDALPGTRAGILSGPSFAADIARGLPTALTLALPESEPVQERLSTPRLRLYRTDDIAGVELGGALKNVVAIACGAAIGAGLGESARAALMTRGMAEMMRLAEALGARRDTLMGLSGLGDLALTCASPGSRNFALGAALGRGAAPPDATTEGVATAQAALELAARHAIDLPVVATTAALVDGRLTVKDAVDALLTRDLREE